MNEDSDLCPICYRVRRDVEPQFNLGYPLGVMCGDCADDQRDPGTALGPDYLEEDESVES